jgi:hypothetical protein
MDSVFPPAQSPESDQTVKVRPETIDYVGVTIVAMGYEAETAASTDEDIKKCRIIAEIPRKQVLRGLSSENMSPLCSCLAGQSTTLLCKSKTSQESQNPFINHRPAGFHSPQDALLYGNPPLSTQPLTV